MEFCVVILSYNHPQLTARAVYSAISLNCPNIFLIHNGSETQHIENLQELFPNIKHLIINTNRGYSGGLNFGLNQAFLNYQWAIVLTNDSQLLNLPKIPDSAAIIAPKVYRRNTKQVDSIGGLFFPSQAKLWHCKTAEQFHQAAANTCKYIPGTAFLIHKEIFQGVGPLQEEFCIYWDDVEWSQRIKEKGFLLDIDETWEISHGLSKTSQNKPLYSLYYFQRNRKIVSWHYCPKKQRIALCFTLLRIWLKLGLRYLNQHNYQNLAYLRQVIFHQAKHLPKK